jgi:hypothetical protein
MRRSTRLYRPLGGPFAALILASACASAAPDKLYEGPRRPGHEVATLRSSWPRTVRLVRLDGSRSVPQYSMAVEVLPGDHQVSAEVVASGGPWSCGFSLEAGAGHEYTLSGRAPSSPAGGALPCLVRIDGPGGAVDAEECRCTAVEASERERGRDPEVEPPPVAPPICGSFGCN